MDVALIAFLKPPRRSYVATYGVLSHELSPKESRRVLFASHIQYLCQLSCWEIWISLYTNGQLTDLLPLYSILNCIKYSSEMGEILCVSTKKLQKNMPSCLGSMTAKNIYIYDNTSRICAIAQSKSDFSIMSGGAKRMTVSCVSLQSSPRSINASQYDRAAVVSSTPINNPRPRTS